MGRLRRAAPDLIIVFILLLLPLGFFAPQTLGDRTLLPTENLYQYEPFATYREVVRAPERPHNHLLSDMVLQNLPWKRFAREQLSAGEIPLWNPHQFGGIPFLAAGQHSMLYPLSAIYLLLELPSAYGWFIVVNLWLAGVFMYAFGRGLGLSRAAAMLAGIVYQLGGFVLASVVFPMMIGGLPWLPLLLLMMENIARARPLRGETSALLPWVGVGAVALGMNILAGHAEITIYTLLIAGYYGGLRLLYEAWRQRAEWRAILLRRGVALALTFALGLGLGSVQLIPLYDFVRSNWRAERSSLETVLSYAHPARDLLQFVLPNFYGSPAQHQYFDLFSGQVVTQWNNAAGQPVTHSEWGIKNYVEGALYLGILPLLLAGFALLERWGLRRRERSPEPPYRAIFAALGAASLSFMFGLPTYALIYFLPGVNQLNSPFRWIFALGLAVAVLAAFGLDALRLHPRLVRRLGIVVAGLGALGIAGLVLARLAYGALAGLFDGLVQNMAGASAVFSDGAMFFSYQAFNAAILCAALLGSGAVLAWAGRGVSTAWVRWGGVRPWQVAALALVSADLMVASWGFNPASDPLLLDFTPPAIQHLLERQQIEGPQRLITLEDPAQRPILNANSGWPYGLDDLRGYDSIIPADTVAMLRAVAPQVQLDFNRSAPIFSAYPPPFEDFDYRSALTSPLLDLLNVRYVLAHRSFDLSALPGYERAYEDEALTLWLNTDAAPRAFTVRAADFATEWMLEPGQTPDYASLRLPPIVERPLIFPDTGREKFMDVQGVDTLLYASADEAGVARIPNLYPASPIEIMVGRGGLVDEAIEATRRETQQGTQIEARGLTPGEEVSFVVRELGDTWLVVSEMYDAGWRAFVRPQGGAEGDEQALPVERVLGNLQGVQLPPGQWTVRLVYSPASFQVGLFGSLTSGALLLLLAGIWLWRLFVGVNTETSTTTARVARNSIAPIVLNLFNRGIDFAFLLVMLRILSPEDVGIYYYLVVVFVWFDILTNFGLDLFLIREVARERSRAGHLFYNTTLLRFVVALLGIPLLLGFLSVRQATVTPPLDAQAILTMALLYAGLLPGTLSKGMSSLFYAFEQAEKPAAIATITTINKAIFGVVVLLLGWGIVGLALVSIFNNLVTLAVLLWTGRGLIGRITRWRPDLPLLRGMSGQSLPLLMNHFLATIFFQIDVIILEAVKGAVIVAQYSVAYRWILAINIIPAFFTQALLPVMSRQAQEDRAALRRTYQFGVKLMFTLAVPVAVGFTVLAEPLTYLMGGQQYLPDGAIAIQLMIWSIPIGWMNSLTQYALVALDLQRRITFAFVAAVTFNIVTNLIFIPQFSYQAAAITTIFSELVLFIPFALLMRQGLGVGLPWGRMLLKPALAGAAMLGAALLLKGVFGLALGALVYGAVLLALRPWDAEEAQMLARILPGRLAASRLGRLALGV